MKDMFQLILYILLVGQCTNIYFCLTILCEWIKAVLRVTHNFLKCQTKEDSCKLKLGIAGNMTDFLGVQVVSVKVASGFSLQQPKSL